ncbi:MAG: pantoate--beta-alanine ligase [Planctomycetota bacterium]|jgi:pantoate--beta-alanine ligase
MRVIHDPVELGAWAGAALVPTMGALHEGHLALMRRARELARPLVISIFVNPTQFGPGEDWQRYPRTLDADLEAASDVGVEMAFAPDVDTIYPPDGQVPVPALPAVATSPGLEDVHRPGHFAGVCQVVARLFDLVKPSVSVFGEKDYQQLLVITEMVRQEGERWGDLSIVGHPTVREADGLAMSSRNRYLDPAQRDQALGLSRALQAACDAKAEGNAPASAEQVMQQVLIRHGLDVHYAAIRDARTLEPIDAFDRPARALIAARLGEVRLIDNMAVAIPGPGDQKRT